MKNEKWRYFGVLGKVQNHNNLCLILKFLQALAGTLMYWKMILRKPSSNTMDPNTTICLSSWESAWTFSKYFTKTQNLIFIHWGPKRKKQRLPRAGYGRYGRWTLGWVVHDLELVQVSSWLSGQLPWKWKRRRRCRAHYREVQARCREDCHGAVPGAWRTAQAFRDGVVELNK